MSEMSNIVQNISKNLLSADKKQNFDVDDNQFSDLLEKQMSIQNDIFNPVQLNPINVGVNGGFDIQDLVSAVGKHDININDFYNEKNVLGSSEMVEYMSRPFSFESLSSGNSGLMNFAKKHAANFYNKCASNVITDLSEFVEDTLKLS